MKEWRTEPSQPVWPSAVADVDRKRPDGLSWATPVGVLLDWVPTDGWRRVGGRTGPTWHPAVTRSAL